MIIHRHKDGSEGYEYQVGDRVIVKETIHGGWFSYGPTRSENCTIHGIERNKFGWRTATLRVKYSNDWGAALCSPWHLLPHPDSFESAELHMEDT